MGTVDELIQQALTQAKAGNKSEAKKILTQVVKQEPENVRAWYFLSQVVEDREQAIYCLKKILELNPDNAQAKERLSKLVASGKIAEAQAPQFSQKPIRGSVNSSESIPREREYGKRKEEPTGIIYTMNGVGELLEVYEDKVAITPRGVWGFLTKGLKGTKTIPFFSVTAIQFKKSGLTSGYLQFTIPGGNENQGGVFSAASDENTFMFTEQNDLAIEIKNYVEKRIQELRKPQVTQTSISIADELKKLADLKEKGILSEEEFQVAKRKLLG